MLQCCTQLEKMCRVTCKDHSGGIKTLKLNSEMLNRNANLKAIETCIN